MSTETDRPRRAASASFELPDGETAVMQGDHAGALLLNPMASVTWQLCDGQRTLEEIAGFICETLADAEPARVLADVRAIVEQLRAAQLLER